MLMRRALVVVLLSLAAGGARAGLFDDDEARKQIADLKADVAANQAATQKALDERMGRLESALRDRAVDLAQMIDGLRQDMTKLRGQIEVLVNQAETMERRHKDLYVDLDTRLRRLEPSFQERVASPEREAQKEK